MGKSHARAARVSLEGVSGIRYDKAKYEVEQPMDALSLHGWVAASPPLQKAIQAVCAARLRRFNGKIPYEQSRKEQQQELALCARAAMLLGDAALFYEVFGRRQEQREEYPFGSGISKEDFWMTVLGEGMAGSSLVPEGAARDEIIHLEALWYALCASPPGRADGRGRLNNIYLQVTVALRAADKPALEALAAQGSALAAAGCALLEGRWGEAAEGFEQSLGWRQSDLWLVQFAQGSPLLLYAALCLVLGQGKVRALEAWLRSLVAEQCRGLRPVFLQETAQEILSFCHHLKAVDGLWNRQASTLSSVRSCDAFGALPLVLAYGVLPDAVRAKLPQEALLKAVDILAEQGHALLAAYGAAAMLQQNISRKWQERLLEVKNAVEGVVLPDFRAEQPTDVFLAALEEIVRREKGRNFLSVKPAKKSLPIILLARKKQEIRLTLCGSNSCDFYPAAVMKTGTPFLYTIRKFERFGRLQLNVSAAERLSALSAEMLSEVELRGSLLPPRGRACQAQASMVVVLQVLTSVSVLVSLRVMLLPESLPLFVAGWGMQVPLVTQGEQTLAVQRDPMAEFQLCESILPALPLTKEQRALLGARGGAICLSLPELLPLLQACHEAQLPLFWRGEQRLRVYQPSAPLSLRLGKSMQDWLEVGAQLEVDEGRVLELSELLSAFGKREGRYMRIGEEEFVLLNENLERQLALLELVWQKKGRLHGVQRCALPLLEAQLDGQGRAAKGGVAAPPPPLPPGLCAELRPYQRVGFEWMAMRADLGLGAILADDMGLGKTVQMLALLLHESQREKEAASLVVAPVSLLGNWKAEARRFAPSLSVRIYDPKEPEGFASLDPHHLLLVSYGQLAAHAEEFSSRSWNVVALDEAQSIKNPDSQRARAVCALKAKKRFCLTGTPIENSLMDLWSEMRFLNPGLFGSRESFSRRFARSEEKERALLRQVLAPLVLRRTKGEVLQQLPALTESLEWVEFSPGERALYESIRREAVKKLGEGEAGGISMLAELTRLRRSCCHGRLALQSFADDSSKLARMQELVAELKEEKRRALIFSQFTDVLDLAEPLLAQAGVSWLRLDGSTPAARRSALVRRFQEGEGDVFLCSLKAGGVGLNLTAADYVLLLDPWWNPAVEEQAASRAHRMGQQNPVTVCRLVVRGTVEERILQMQQEKKQLAESILSVGSKGVSLEVLRSLLVDEDAPKAKG